MGIWVDAPDDSVSYKLRYYCTRCEKFFLRSPIAPGRCPYCFCDDRYVLGPLLTEEVDMQKLIKKQRKKYQGKLSR